MKKSKRTANVPFGFVESLRGMAAFEAGDRYQEQIRSTPAGCRSDDLRNEAHGLVRLGVHDRAHALFLQAMAQHQADDEGAAAAACWFDLAMSTTRLRSGVRSQNLMEAARLFRRAEASPARRADPRRHILSLDGLGQCLRSLSLEVPSAESMCTEALQHLRKAVDLARANGIATLDLLANALTNLGNALNQADKVDDAIHTHAESVRVAEWIARTEPRIADLMTGGLDIPRRRMNPVGALVHRGRRTDLKRALDIIDLIVTEHSPSTPRAHLAGYEVARRIGGARGDRALSHLEQVDPYRLLPEEQRRLLTALSSEGQFDRALTIARHGVVAALAERRNASADAMADHPAVEAQQFARLAAELLAGADRPVDAFLELENTAALRYFDVVTSYGWAPQTPLLRALHNLYRRGSQLSVSLEDIALRIAGADPAADKLWQLFDVAAQRLAELPGGDFEWLGSNAQTSEVLEQAKKSANPGDVLREHARALREAAGALMEEIARLDPSSETWANKVTDALLEQLFAEQPGVVLVRLSMDDEALLAITVRKDDGKLTGSSTRVSVSKDTINALFTLTRDDPAPEPVTRANATKTLEAFLATIDWSKVIPARTAHVIVLPSLVASLVPWAASGHPGATLLDVADAISYLPNLTPLIIRQAPMSPRSGVVVVMPAAAPAAAPTQFHALAFAEPGTTETMLREAEARKEEVRTRAASADIVSFFAHGHYGQDAPAGVIRLADGDFNPAEHADAWRGMERVELWACRSGVNVSYDPLTPWVDEAFGLDVIFHLLGVRSTIGTFWNVPELVTAQLVREYRRALTRRRSAPAALADAMRWWRAQGIAHTRSILESDAPAQQLRQLFTSLGTDAHAVDIVVANMLGPVSMSGKLAPEKVEELVRAWASPTAWAGFRFLGVHERRPLGPPVVFDVRVLTPEEHDTIRPVLLR